jgi:hypothetical protein
LFVAIFEGSRTPGVLGTCGRVLLELHRAESVLYAGLGVSILLPSLQCHLQMLLQVSSPFRCFKIGGKLQLQPYLNRRLSIFKAVILSSRVEGDMASLTAAPDGPETRPLLSASAASTISRSLCGLASRLKASQSVARRFELFARQIRIGRGGRRPTEIN